VSPRCVWGLEFGGWAESLCLCALRVRVSLPGALAGDGLRAAREPGGGGGGGGGGAPAAPRPQGGTAVLLASWKAAVRARWAHPSCQKKSESSTGGWLAGWLADDPRVVPPRQRACGGSGAGFGVVLPSRGRTELYQEYPLAFLTASVLLPVLGGRGSKRGSKSGRNQLHTSSPIRTKGGKDSSG
jgi:hypothetical protein